MEFASLVIVAILVEAIWENLKMLYPENKFSFNMLGALLLGIIVCILAKIDIFTLVGIDLSIKLLAYIFTGIIVSRGANFINDLFKRLKGNDPDRENHYIENAVEYNELSSDINDTEGNK